MEGRRAKQAALIMTFIDFIEFGPTLLDEDTAVIFPNMLKSLARPPQGIEVLGGIESRDLGIVAVGGLMIIEVGAINISDG